MNRDDGVQARALILGDQDFLMTFEAVPRVNEYGDVACHANTLEEVISEGIRQFLWGIDCEIRRNTQYFACLVAVRVERYGGPQNAASMCRECGAR